MNTNDQWFEPGDKVMRVAYQPKPGAMHAREDGSKDAEYGQIYCVELCGECSCGYNVLHFVGFPKDFDWCGRPIGFVASNFRRVEEIKLCVEAAAKMKQPKKSTVLVGDGEEEG